MDGIESGQMNAPSREAHPTPKEASYSRRKRRWRIAKWIVGILLVGSGFGVWAIQDDVRTLASLRQIPGTNAYVMDYYCDYHLEELRDGMDINHVEDELVDAFFPWGIEQIAKSARTAFVPGDVQIVPSDTERCTSVVYRNERGEMLVGRNLDWMHDASLVLRVHKAGQIASISIIDLAYLNGNRSDLTATHIWERLPLLFAPYYLQDGMNRDGLVITDMTLQGSQPPLDPAKPNMMHSTAMRLVLDDARSTAEAIAVLQRYNIHFGVTQCHFLIADAKGDSAVVEFLEGVMRVTHRKGEWQVCTNHPIWGTSEQESDEKCDRYQRASELLATYKEDIGVEQIMDVMDRVAVNDWTMWSSVYNLTSGEVLFTHRKGKDRNQRTVLNLK